MPIRLETSTPIPSDVSARPRWACAMSTTYEPFATAWPRMVVVEAGLAHLDAVEEQPVDEAVRLGVAALACPERDHVRARELVHPVVLAVERRRAARRPRLAGDAAPVDLELVVEEIVSVRRVEQQRRPAHRQLRQQRRVPADRVLGRVGVGVQVAAVERVGPRIRAAAHLDRRAVQADELRVHRRVEGAPVVPALGDRRAGRLAVRADRALNGDAAVGAPVVDRASDAHVDGRPSPPRSRRCATGSTSARGRSRSPGCAASSSPRSASA